MRYHGLAKGMITAATVAVFLAGCGKSTPPSLEGGGETGGIGAIFDDGVSSADAVGKSVYRLMYYDEINTLNYLQTGLQVDYAIAANLVDCLVDYDRYGNIIPGLADSWSSNADMTEWTFHIREGVKWVDCDGKEVADVTADDWVAAAQYVNDAANASENQYTYSTGSLVTNAQAYYDYTSYMIESAGGTKTTDDEGNAIEPVPEVRPEDIGVKAPDPYTLVYTLDQPCPFFLSVLSYTSYMPVNREFLETAGDMFGRSKENILYNGAYRLSEYVPQERRVMVRNESYWDKENVLIDVIEAKFRADMLEIAPEAFLNGEIDQALISRETMEEWMSVPERASQVHSMRPDIAYSYFYCFNFDPEFGTQYEPENWAKAVVNENFRKALMYALDLRALAEFYEPYNPDILLQDTITPENFVSAGGKDYTDFAPFARIGSAAGSDRDAAIRFRDAAREELEAQGVSFPVKVLVPYGPTTINWDLESAEVKRQLEETLGNDFIEVMVERGPDTGFLSAVRRSGKYALLLCNFGADYADPETYTIPFIADNTYNFWDRCTDPEVKSLFEQYDALISQANTTYEIEQRYELFAEAEALLIEHAIVIPNRVSNGEGYVADRLSQFDGEFAPYGLARERYKGKYLHESSMSIEEFNEAYEQWETERLNSVAE